MKFFQGDVIEAVAERQNRGVAFVVFVEGRNFLSASYKSILEEEDRIPEEEYVAVRIFSHSPQYRKFSDIYRTVPVPSVFVIGERGVPLAILSSPLRKDELLSALEGAIKSRKRRDSVHILLKLPTGETAAVEFPETSTLRDVRLYVKNTLNVKYPFHMTMPFPRRIFAKDGECRTLISVELGPASTVLVVRAEDRSLRLRAYDLAVNAASEILRIFGRIKLWLTRFFTTP